MSEHTIQLEPGAARESSSWRLEVISGPHAETVWVFDRPQELTLGRTQPSQLRLPNEPAMSRTHLRIQLAPRGAQIEDLKSSNGTRINGVHVVISPIAHADVIEIGQTRIRFCFNAIAADGSLEGPITDVDLATQATDLPETMHVRDVRIAAPISPLSPKPEFEVTRFGNASPSPDPSDLFSATVAPSASDQAPAASDQDATVRGSGAAMFPTQVGPYRILELLGQGGMATVHLAKHLRTNEKVAVKLIRSDLPVGDKQTRLFLREAGVLTRLDHPRIVRAIEFGMEGSTPYLVMQYIPTIDLLALLDKSSAAEKIKVATWSVFCVLQAVHYAHAQGIVHRDIKPGNLLAYREGRHLRVKLADFGLAKCYEDAGFSQMTNERSVRGTLAYMAPEQFKNSRDASPAVDLFACGACLYRLVTGQLPNVMIDRVKTLDRLRESTGVPETLKGMIAKSIHQDPKERFATATEFAEAIHPFHKRR